MFRNVCLLCSNVVQKKGEKCRSNAHFSGVHQFQHVRAFHVVLIKNSAPLLLFALSSSWSRWLESDAVIEKSLF